MLRLGREVRGLGASNAVGWRRASRRWWAQSWEIGASWKPEIAGETSQQRKQERAGVGSGSWGVVVAVCNGEQRP